MPERSPGEELADRLIGTAGIGVEHEVNELSDEEGEKFRELAFNCEDCGWWFAAEELHNHIDGVERCEDCSDRVEDEEEDEE